MWTLIAANIIDSYAHDGGCMVWPFGFVFTQISFVDMFWDVLFSIKFANLQLELEIWCIWRG